MVSFWINSASIADNVYIPKFYSPEITNTLTELQNTHDCISLGKLVDLGVITCSTGDEIGKLAYGTGDIPFIRTSDIANWEIKAAPKQGISRSIFDEYSISQDVREGDILFVKDGTYLIGNSCFITSLERELIYQSHIYKIRTVDPNRLNPLILFLALNSAIAQKQIRSFQFSSDIIDTIGKRFFDIVLPIPRDSNLVEHLVATASSAFEARVKGKAFIKNAPFILEEVLLTGRIDPVKKFLSLSDEALLSQLRSETITKEFGEFEAFVQPSNEIKNQIFLPKYYDPSLHSELMTLEANCTLVTMGELKERGILDYHTGDEIGKMAYGTGDIPFIRTSDFSNWEISYQSKQGVSEEIYESYCDRQDVRVDDILLVRDGTYLIGSSCIITESDQKCLFCGGLYKIRVMDHGFVSPFLLLALLNSYVVKRQIRSKQFTRDVIDTIGNRIDEIVIPIPKDDGLRDILDNYIKGIVHSRIESRNVIKKLTSDIVLTQKTHGEYEPNAHFVA